MNSRRTDLSDDLDESFLIGLTSTIVDDMFLTKITENVSIETEYVRSDECNLLLMAEVIDASDLLVRIAISHHYNLLNINVSN